MLSLSNEKGKKIEGWRSHGRWFQDWVAPFNYACWNLNNSIIETQKEDTSWIHIQHSVDMHLLRTGNNNLAYKNKWNAFRTIINKSIFKIIYKFDW